MIKTELISYNLSFADSATAVSSRQRRGTRLGVPRHFTILRGTANRQSVNTVSVAVTVTVVLERAAVTRRPDKD